MVQIHAVSAFQDNYVWMLVADGRAAAVDPGEAAPVQRFLESRGLTLAAILATHHHPDHIGGVPELVSRWSCPVFGPAHDGIDGLDRGLAEGDHLEVPGLGYGVRVLDIPAHTAGHIAFVHDGPDPAVFCGDTLFACGCGRLFEGTAAQMAASLAKLAALAPATRVYCGHEYTLSNIRFAQAVEPENGRLAERRVRDAAKRDRGEPTVPSTIEEELATNPFLRCGEPAVVAAAQGHARHALAGEVEVFAAIRAWKDSF